MRRVALWVAIGGLACGADDGPSQQTATTVAMTSSPSDDDDDGSTTSGSTDRSTSSDPSTASTPSDPSDSVSTTVGEESSTGEETDTTVGPRCAPAPDPNAPWLASYTDAIVGPLTGAVPIVAGTSLPERSTAANRMLAAEFITGAFEDLGLEVDQHVYSSSGTNVVARLPATESNARTFVVGAHYDSVPGSPGANDNATGMALVLSLARYLSEVECRSHDVLFVAFDEEEIGLIGSDAFAQRLVQLGLDVQSVHTVDQMGWDQDGDRTIELERADEGLYEFYEAATLEYDLDVFLSSTQTGFTDHVSFRPYGFAAVGLTEEFVGGDTTPHYHLSSDRYDTVNFDFLVSTCALVNGAFALQVSPS